jgi:CRP/FNR family transcriptional regulator, cyclic AMP receptor protein
MYHRWSRGQEEHPDCLRLFAQMPWPGSWKLGCLGVNEANANRPTVEAGSTVRPRALVVKEQTVVSPVPGVFHNAKSVQDLAAGTVLFEEGATGSEMYGVIEGEIELRTTAGQVFRVGPNETFGEMALIDRSERMASAVATADTKLAVIDQNTFLFLVQETPTFALQVMRTLTDRLRAALE